jgi:hypothetical protein
MIPISLSGRWVFIFGLFVSPEISVYSENREQVPTLCNHLCMLHFMWPNKSHDGTIETPTNHSSLCQDKVFCSVENNAGISSWFVISKKVSSLQITLKLHRNHNLNNCAPMDFLFIRLCPRPSNPNTVWKLRLSAFCVCFYFFVS